jgi:phospholipid/cholesterol/gamma-HCH transport system permease protein
MPEDRPSRSAQVSVRLEAGCLEVAVSGDWRLTEAAPQWAASIAGRGPGPVRFLAADLGYWDTSLLLFLFDAQQWCLAAGAGCDTAGLPEKVRNLLAQLGSSHEAAAPNERSETFLITAGLAAYQAWQNILGIFHFVGECAIGAAGLARGSRKFRWRDCVDQMQECGAKGLPIVSLISFLVGLTLAYQAAVELRQFGADIFVADVVGLSTVREMGPMMAAVILAGRTGAAFAATLGNMKANEEIDALETLGIPAVDFLVLPRLLALGLMMPLLTLYANCVGILGGMVVASGILQIPPSAYWVETQGAIDLADINTGLVKATTFGILIGLAGCLRGLQAERSAAGVGRAATSAVVTAILLIIVADSVYAVLFHILGV